MHLIATAARDSSVALDNPFMLLIVVSAVVVTGSIVALLGTFGLIVAGRGE